MFGKISYTWDLMRSSWDVLKSDKRLLVFPLLSAICCLLVMASFAIPIGVTDSWRPPGEDAAVADQVAYYGVLFLFYFCNYFVIVFFNSAVVACALIRMQGGEATVGDGLRASVARLPLIVGWALVAATFGLILRIIEDRSEKVGRIVAGLLGMAWSLMTFLVVPIMVVEKKGPFAALKDSTVLLKKTWGEQLIGNFSFGLVFFLLAIPAFLVIALGVFMKSMVALVVCIVLAAVYLIVLSLIQSALYTIFQTALYCYARSGQAPVNFSQDLLVGAMNRG